MIEWFLSNNGYHILQALLLTITLTPLLLLGLYNKLTHRYESSLISMFITSTFMALLGTLSLLIICSTKTEYVSDESWKQIYTNDIDATVKIKIDARDFIFTLKDELVAGENINNKQYKYKRLQ